MRLVIQRVKASQVTVEGKIVGQIGRGLNILVGITPTDTIAVAEQMARKCLDLRLFPGENGPDKWEKSVREIQGELLVISQFTLYGDCRKGRRPSFSDSASGAIAFPIYQEFVQKLGQSGLRVETGVFGALMLVTIENDGPVTLILEQ